MSTSNIPPSVERLISTLSRRVDTLERRLKALESAYEPELPFVQSGAVSPGESPPWIRRKAGRLTDVVVLLGQAGTTPTDVEVRKNGRAVYFATLAAGVNQLHMSISVSASANTDRFTVAVTKAGAGAVDLTVVTRWDQ